MSTKKKKSTKQKTKQSAIDYSEQVIVSANKHEIYIKFDEILEDENISHMNEFNLKKRSYYGIADLIADSIKLFFNNCSDKIIVPYLGLVYNIKDDELPYSFEDFKEDIRRDILNDEIVSFINTYVDSTYVYQMDKKTEEVKKTKRINQELQFTDEHVKILLKSAQIIRLVIPLITEFCDKRKENDINECLYDTFEMIIDKFQDEINILNKIHRFIYSRVVQTQYSDKVMWTLFDSNSKDVNIITVNFLKEIVIGIIPKAIQELNIINLFHVVVRKKIHFEFIRNHKISFKPVNLNQVDSEGLTPFDKWEIGMSKKNESKIVVNKLSIVQQIQNVKEGFGINFDKDEFEYYKERLHINKFQTNLLFLFFAKYMVSYQSLYNCDRDQYTALLIIFYKWLKQHGFDDMADYVIAKPDKLNEKRMTTNSTKTKIYEQVTSSKDYNELLDNKFSFIKYNLYDSSLIIKLIGNLTVSKYLKTIPYDEYDGNEYEPEEIDVKFESLANEMNNFLKII